MLREVRLYGHLAERFGDVHRFDVASPAECVCAMQCNYPDFYAALKDGNYYVFRGPKERSACVPEEELLMSSGPGPFHIVPELCGSGGDFNTKAVIQTVLGVALIGAAMVLSGGLAGMGATAVTMPMGIGTITYGQIALLGAVLALGGIYQLLAPTPELGLDEKGKDKKQSFLFSGAINRTEQGQPIPVVFGLFRVGSTVIESAIDLEDHSETVDDDYHNVTLSYANSGGTAVVRGGLFHNQGNQAWIMFVPNDGYQVASVRYRYQTEGIWYATGEWSQAGMWSPVLTDNVEVEITWELIP